MDTNEKLTYRRIFLFWGPLALTWLMMALEQPILIAFIARLNDAKFNLAAFGIAGSFAMIGKEKQNYKELRNFAIYLGILVTVLISLLAFTPLAGHWFINVSGLSEDLAALSYLPLKIMILLPALTVLLNFQRSSLIINRNTVPISIATAVELAGIIAVLLVCVVFLNFIGVVAASVAFIAGKGFSTIYLMPKQMAAVRSWKKL